MSRIVAIAVLDGANEYKYATILVGGWLEKVVGEHL